MPKTAKSDSKSKELESFEVSLWQSADKLRKNMDAAEYKHYVLTPGRYIGLPDEEDDFDFTEHFGELKAELDEQMKEEVRLNELIRTNLAELVVNK